MALPILTYPHNLLSTPCFEVKIFDNKLIDLVNNMILTMRKCEGIGIAAPQIGYNLRIFIAQDRIFINPKINVIDDSIISSIEGCLSIPEIFEKVQRAQVISVTYQDQSGISHQLEAKDDEAICIQHEYDHLNGILFLDRLSDFKRRYIKKKIAKSHKL